MGKHGRRRPAGGQARSAPGKRQFASSKLGGVTAQNPFNAKFNREKESVLGKRPPKMGHGKPGMAKKKMVDRRSKTLLSEYHGTKRTGSFEDTRLGEADLKLSSDEKMFLRYAAERKKTFESKLSATGFDDQSEELPVRQHMSKKSTEHSYGGMSEQAVAEIHFGKGGEEGDRKDWRDRLDQLIADSKQAKFERHAEKYHTSDMVDELDEDWSVLRGAIFAAGAPLPPEAAKEAASDQPADIFDKAVKELRFEQCPDHHKLTEAQQAAATSERKRRRFEEETEVQMNVVFATQDKQLPVHISADALEEDIAAIIKQSSKKKAAAKTSIPAYEESNLQLRGGGKDVDMASLGGNLSSALQQLRVRFNPELHPDNKEKFVRHFVHYLKFVFGADESDEEQPLIATLLPDLNEAINLLFDLIRTYLSYAENALRSVISSHLRLFCHPTEELSLDKLGRCYCLLKLIPAVFPTSDDFHAVTTPAFALLAAVLRSIATTVSSPSFKPNSDPLSFICLGVSFIDLGIQFVCRSRRYFPEVILCFVHIFEALFTLKDSTDLHDNNEKCAFSKLPCHHNVAKFFDQIVMIAGTICNLWADIPGNQVFFKDIVACLQKMENNSKVSDVLESFANCISKSLVPLKPRSKPAEEIKQLPTFTPLISSEKDIKRKKETAAVKTTRLKRQIKKEYRHAVRELRRDNEFLARQSLTERLVEDEERERKTKQILGQLSMQEGEYRKFNK